MSVSGRVQIVIGEITFYMTLIDMAKSQRKIGIIGGNTIIGSQMPKWRALFFFSLYLITTMATVTSFVPDAARALSFKASKVGGVYHKPLSGRKRAELVKTLHDPTPKKWELREPKGVVHDQKKPARYVQVA